MIRILLACVGGAWDSRFFQPIDFFGNGSRIPLLAAFQFSRGGQMVHPYTTTPRS